MTQIYIVIGLSIGIILAVLIVFTLNQRKQLGELKERVTSILLDAAKENQKQIEKNSQLAGELLSTSSKLNETLKSELYRGFKDITDKFDSINVKITNSLDNQTEKNKQEIDRFIKLVGDGLSQISDRVDLRLKDGFENVDRTFKDIVEGIAKISEAQRKIEQLSSEVVSLQRILDDKKKRGIFGEVRLESILESVFGPKRELYGVQYELDNHGKKVIADAVVKAPQVGLIAVDSKFPLENYVKMVNAEQDRKEVFKKAFEQNLKKHIDDIADKYIIKGTTADMAILFLPAEAIFAQINAYHQEVLAYAYARKVWIASPTTLMALLTTVSAAVRDARIQKQAKKIQDELIKLSKEFERYKGRWTKFLSDVKKLHKDAEEVNTTTEKITKAFERIENAEFEPKELSSKNHTSL